MSEAIALDLTPAAGPAGDVIHIGPLGEAPVGGHGVIIRVTAQDGALPAEELERRLLELGFVEGAAVEVLHEGAFGGDPIAVKLDDMRVAIRRREAACIQVRFDTGDGA